MCCAQSFLVGQCFEMTILMGGNLWTTRALFVLCVDPRAR